MRLIDADALKEKAMYVEYGLIEMDAVTIYDIDNSPTIDPVKHAHWIPVMLERTVGTLKGIKCSNCGHERIKGSLNEPKYCQDCGANMDKEVS